MNRILHILSDQKMFFFFKCQSLGGYQVFSRIYIAGKDLLLVHVFRRIRPVMQSLKGIITIREAI